MSVSSRPHVLPALGAACLAVLAVSACSGGGDDKPTVAQSSSTPSASATTPACVAAGEEVVHAKGAGGDSLFAVHVGGGATAVVVMPDAKEGLCPWLPLARRIATAAHASVWVGEPTSSASGLSSPGATGATAYWDDVATLSQQAEDGGASRLVLLGSGTGALGVLRQGESDGDVIGVFALSPDEGAGVAAHDPVNGPIPRNPQVLVGAGDKAAFAKAKDLATTWGGSSAQVVAVPGTTAAGAQLLTVKAPTGKGTVADAIVAWTTAQQ